MIRIVKEHIGTEIRNTSFQCTSFIKSVEKIKVRINHRGDTTNLRSRDLCLYTSAGIAPGLKEVEVFIFIAALAHFSVPAVPGEFKDPCRDFLLPKFAADVAKNFAKSFLPEFSAHKWSIDILIVNDLSVRIHSHGRPAAEIQKRFHPVFQKKFQHLIEHAEIIASGRTPVCQHQLPGEDIPDTRVLKVQVVAQIKAVFLNIRLGQVMHFANIDHSVTLGRVNNIVANLHLMAEAIQHSDTCRDGPLLRIRE